MKTSTAHARELDFQGLEGFGSVYFCYFGVVVSGWLREWILSDLGFISGVILGAQINDKTLTNQC